MKFKTVVLICLLSCGAQQEKPTEKINGLCLVAPPFEITSEHYKPIRHVKANWVAIVPYGFCSPSQPEVIFDHQKHWQGETTAGIQLAVNLAHEANLKVLLKPHLWVRGQGWAGDLQFESDESLIKWQKSYSQYILHFAQVADSLNVEMISIGTEIRHLAADYPNYWKTLIQQIKVVYSGKLTYSANWDNYQNISFWSALDFIGVDAYFPLSKSKTPSINELIEQSEGVKSALEQFAKSHLKKVLFTEFGFQSIDYCAAGHWESGSENSPVNFVGQSNAYEALFETYWQEDWFAGGFAWKWHYQHQKAGGSHDKEFTPQNKLAEKILKNQYSKFNPQ